MRSDPALLEDIMPKEGDKVSQLEKEIERLRRDYRRTTKNSERFSLDKRIRKFRNLINEIVSAEPLPS